MALEIVRSTTNGVTGHIECHVRAVEELSPGQISKGPIEVIGIDHQSLMNIYHAPGVAATTSTTRDAILKWLGVHHPSALRRKHAIESSSAVVDALRGQMINFEEVSK
jgi:hypothetical protein